MATGYEHKKSNMRKQNSGLQRNWCSKTDKGDWERSVKQMEGEGGKHTKS